LPHDQLRAILKKYNRLNPQLSKESAK
jgi:hypothetical protein